ncbi:SagB/ThcOx family dehydrogenase [Bacillus sp. SB49]|uniref:SagB family peptide dehydrogenase n=1 Tax=Bacillus sp. SB49 TaxID=1071080 RepID=UPI00040C03E3|nr:SagB family peptide dehydrogenase [Bacillus sp. SB49]QHT45330.1 SagB/ThcOx family dehydrogenase [Bacillus sp. SB49]
MHPESFLYRLHFQSQAVIPSDWEVDWEDAPLPYKLYKELPSFLLDHHIPLNPSPLGRRKLEGAEWIGHFLWFAYGLTQFAHTAAPADSEEKTSTSFPSLRRFAPSGGGLYPSELYLYVKETPFAQGVYHYDAAHHRLVLIREGNFDDYITKTLGLRLDVSSCKAVCFITTVYWKNFFKYHNFSFRLQGLDAGAVISQTEETARQFGLHSRVHLSFLHKAADHLLGLNRLEETTLGILALSEQEIPAATGKEELTGASLIEEIPAVQTTCYQRSKHIKPHQDILQLHEAAILSSSSLFRTNASVPQQEKYGKDIYPLSESRATTSSFRDACMNRCSPEGDFIDRSMDAGKIAALLKQSTLPDVSSISIYLCINGTDRIDAGAYEYDPASHSLLTIEKGDFRQMLQSGMTMHNVPLHHTPLCIHVAGARNVDAGGYRMQLIHAGRVMQRILLAASALGMNGHPLLGFHVPIPDSIYQLDIRNQTTLIQIPIGYHTPKSRLSGVLHA